MASFSFNFAVESDGGAPDTPAGAVPPAPAPASVSAPAPTHHTRHGERFAASSSSSAASSPDSFGTHFDNLVGLADCGLAGWLVTAMEGRCIRVQSSVWMRASRTRQAHGAHCWPCAAHALLNCVAPAGEPLAVDECNHVTRSRVRGWEEEDPSGARIASAADQSIEKFRTDGLERSRRDQKRVDDDEDPPATILLSENADPSGSEDKKRKPSRDFPAHAQVPVGKVQSSVKMRLDLNQTSANTVPPMHDPFNILNGNAHGHSMRSTRTVSMISMDSVSSVVSVDDGFRVSDTDYNLDEERARLSLPKDERPPQPADEREYFERLWAENFERSEAQVANTTAFIPAGAAGRLNRIKGFSFARDSFTHRLYAVFRLEVECIVNEKQWTIYRRFHDFKQLAHQLKNESIRVPTVPTRTLMRSLDANFLRKRQSELDRWLREVLMLISLENCKVDTDKASECCGNRGFHTSCRIIRHFLTHSANEPPVFENADNPSVSPGRPPLHSISEHKAPSSPSMRSTSMSVPSSSQIDMLSSSLRESDLMGMQSYAQDSDLEAPREQRRSVIVQDVDDDMEGQASSYAAAVRKGKVTLKHFDVLRMIGRGSFGKVLLVRKKNSSQLFAVKILNKPTIVKKQQVEHTRTERRVLASISHPFVVCLHYAFQTKDQLYFVLDYCPGGDLFFHLSRCGYFPEPMAKFYTAEIVLALIHLHEQGIVYRDLKPENIMLDVEGHVKLADFGLAKEGITGELDGTYTMCGTPEYLPPEILNRAGHGTAVDWWNLGMVLYEMLTGRPPWYTQDREELFNRLREAELEFPEGLSVEAMDLIRGLLTRDPAKRLGAIDPREITYHPFFGDIDWNLLYNRQVEPLYRPCQYTDPIDAANFEEEFTKLPLAQIDGHGLNVAPQSNVANANGNGGAVGNDLHAVNGRSGSVSGSTGGRNSTLRNMSYTFAGFTYDGSSSLARSSLDRASNSLSPVNNAYI